MNPRILFVDDDVNLIEALRRLLRNKRKSWEMEFSVDPSEALLRVGASCFDIVVCDMRMPVLDGAVVLQRITEICPTSVRIVLSGQADESTILRCLPVAHQHIAKPASVSSIERIIDRAHSAQQYLGRPEFRSALARSASIPVSSGTFARLKEELLSASPSLLILEDLAVQEPALGLKFIQLVSSSFFGHAEEVDSPGNAVRRLGVDILRKIVLEKKLITELSPDTARLLSEASPENVENDFFLTVVQAQDAHKGIAQQGFAKRCVHLANTLFASYWPNEFCQVQELMRNGNLNVIQAEQQVIGTTAVALLLYLLTIWGIPQHLIENIAQSAGEHNELRENI